MICRAKVARSPDESRGTRACFDTQACPSLFAECQGEPRADRSSKGYFVPSASPG